MRDEGKGIIEKKYPLIASRRKSKGKMKKTKRQHAVKSALAVPFKI